MLANLNRLNPWKKKKKRDDMIKQAIPESPNSIQAGEAARHNESQRLKNNGLVGERDWQRAVDGAINSMQVDIMEALKMGSAELRPGNNVTLATMNQLEYLRRIRPHSGVNLLYGFLLLKIGNVSQYHMISRDDIDAITNWERTFKTTNYREPDANDRINAKEFMCKYISRLSNIKTTLGDNNTNHKLQYIITEVEEAWVANEHVRLENDGLVGETDWQWAVDGAINSMQVDIMEVLKMGSAELRPGYNVTLATMNQLESLRQIKPIHPVVALLYDYLLLKIGNWSQDYQFTSDTRAITTWMRAFQNHQPTKNERINARVFITNYKLQLQKIMSNDDSNHNQQVVDDASSALNVVDDALRALKEAAKAEDKAMRARNAEATRRAEADEAAKKEATRRAEADEAAKKEAARRAAMTQEERDKEDRDKEKTQRKRDMMRKEEADKMEENAMRARKAKATRKAAADKAANEVVAERARIVAILQSRFPSLPRETIEATLIANDGHGGHAGFALEALVTNNGHGGRAAFALDASGRGGKKNRKSKKMKKRKKTRKSRKSRKYKKGRKSRKH